jgi:hypothetical protein
MIGAALTQTKSLAHDSKGIFLPSKSPAKSHFKQPVSGSQFNGSDGSSSFQIPSQY